MIEFEERYFDLLLKEVSQIIADNKLDKRDKFAQITRVSDTILSKFQVASIDYANFKDLDLSKFSLDEFNTPSFPAHAIGT